MKLFLALSVLAILTVSGGHWNAQANVNKNQDTLNSGVVRLTFNKTTTAVAPMKLSGSRDCTFPAQPFIYT